MLVVEDEAAILQWLLEILERAGYEVFSAADGQEAESFLQEHRVDVVVTDLVMPEKDGIELIRKLRRDASPARIIAISGAFSGQFLPVAKHVGADAVLAKPFSSEALLQVIASLVPESGSAQPGRQ